MTLTAFPFGVSSFGMPVLPGGPNFTTGNVYFVDSGATNATNGNTGDAPQVPLATLNGAFDKVTPNQGDIIYLMPGHTEDTANSTTLVCDIAGVSVIGLGWGATRPKFTFSNANGTFEIDAADIIIQNVIFETVITAVVTGVNVDGANARIINCLWDFESSGDDFLAMVNVEGVDGVHIQGCEFIAQNAAGANEAISFANADDFVIKDNWFYGDFAVSAIHGTTITATGAAASQNVLIADNMIYNADTASASNVVKLLVAHQGLLANTRAGSLDADAAGTSIDPGSLHCLENYVASAIDETGVVVPTKLTTG